MQVLPEQLGLEPVTLERVELEPVTREQVLASDPALLSDTLAAPSFKQVRRQALLARLPWNVVCLDRGCTAEKSDTQWMTDRVAVAGAELGPDVCEEPPGAQVLRLAECSAGEAGRCACRAPGAAVAGVRPVAPLHS